MLNNDFKCKRCGECCKILTIYVNKRDSARINKLGYEDYNDFDNFIKKPILKKPNNKCIFLTKVGKKYSCKIYESRPKACKDYPPNIKNNSCKPKDVYEYAFFKHKKS